MRLLDPVKGFELCAQFGEGRGGSGVAAVQKVYRIDFEHRSRARTWRRGSTRANRG